MEVMQKPANKLNRSLKIKSTTSSSSATADTTSTAENPKSSALIRKYSDKLNRNLIDKIEPLGFLKTPDSGGGGGGVDSIVVIKNKLRPEPVSIKNENEDDDEHDELLADLDDVVDSGLLEKEINQLDRLLKGQIKKTNNECNNNQTNNNNNTTKLNNNQEIQTSSIKSTIASSTAIEFANTSNQSVEPAAAPSISFNTSHIDSTLDADTKPLVSDTSNNKQIQDNNLHHDHLHAHRHRHTHRHHNHHHHYHIINNFDTSESTDDPTTPHYNSQHHNHHYYPSSPFLAKSVDNKKEIVEDEDLLSKPIIIDTSSQMNEPLVSIEQPAPSLPLKSEQSNLSSVSQNFYSTPDLTNLLVSERGSSSQTSSPIVNLNSSLNNLNDEKNVNRAAIKTIVDYESLNNSSYLAMASTSDEKILLNNSKIISNLKTSLNIINNNNLNKKSSQKFKMLLEGDVQVCKLPYSRNVISKILNSKLLRRWKTHRLILTESDIYSTTKTDYMDSNIPYHNILEVSPISKWEPGQKYYLRIATFECHYLIQTNNVYVRDQWTHSIIWKKHKFKSEKVLRTAIRPEVLIREIKNMIEMSLTIPIDDSEIYQFPLELVSEILQKHHFPKQTHEEVIVCLSPLLEKNHPSPEICDFFSRHCRDSPRSHIVIEMFTPVVQRILKHNDDFGRYLRMRLFIQDYLMALMSQNTGLETVQNFVRSMHSTSSQCPFPRVLPNFVAVCLAAIHGCFEQRTNYKTQKITIVKLSEHEREEQILCYTTMLLTMAKYEDWRVNVAQLLQSVPFPDQALVHEKFVKIFKKVVEKIAEDSRCEVHQTLLGIREGKEGWFEVFCPGGISCDDDGELFGLMLKTLMGCCCKKKRFLLSINKLLSHIIVLAIREVPSAIETLCAMLDLDGVEKADNKLQIISALSSTPLGTKMYALVCERQKKLKELQQKGGPRKLTLPSRSTDDDLARLLLSGSFGNLECLSLAFTNVTSACAEYLIKLPSLRYLNLWSTKFGDEGLELISEHLQRLQVLNLCETPVTDKGLACLASMKQLRKLNLNSTNLSALTFEGLKESLPFLQECDIRYTDAW